MLYTPPIVQAWMHAIHALEVGLIKRIIAALYPFLDPNTVQSARNRYWRKS